MTYLPLLTTNISAIKRQISQFQSNFGSKFGLSWRSLRFAALSCCFYMQNFQNFVYGSEHFRIYFCNIWSKTLLCFGFLNWCTMSKPEYNTILPPSLFFRKHLYKIMIYPKNIWLKNCKRIWIKNNLKK